MTSRTLESLHRFKASVRYDAIMNRTSDRDIQILPLDKISPDPDQPRKVFEEAKLKELSSNIRAHGVLQAIVVQPADSEGVYKIIMGERRYRASLLAGLEAIPVVVKEATSELRAVQLSENIQRQELTTIEIARAIDHLKTEGRSRKSIAQSLGWSESQISLFGSVLKMCAPLQVLAEQNVQVRALCELQKLWKQDRASVESFLSRTSSADITRVSVKSLGDRMASKASPRFGSEGDIPGPASSTPVEVQASEDEGQPSNFRIVFYCDHGGRRGTVLTDRLGSSSRHVLVRYEGGDAVEDVALSDLIMLEVVST